MTMLMPLPAFRPKMIMMVIAWPTALARRVSANKLFFERQTREIFYIRGGQAPKWAWPRTGCSQFELFCMLFRYMYMYVYFPRQAREYFWMPLSLCCCLSGPRLFVGHVRSCLRLIIPSSGPFHAFAGIVVCIFALNTANTFNQTHVKWCCLCLCLFRCVACRQI